MWAILRDYVHVTRQLRNIWYSAQKLDYLCSSSNSAASEDWLGDYYKISRRSGWIFSNVKSAIKFHSSIHLPNSSYDEENFFCFSRSERVRAPSLQLTFLCFMKPEESLDRSIVRHFLMIKISDDDLEVRLRSSFTVQERHHYRCSTISWSSSKRQPL